MATLLGSLLVSLGLDSGEFKSGLGAAEKEMRRTAKRIEGIGAGLSNVGRNLSIAVTAPLAALSVAAVKGAQAQAAAMGQVEAALASMGMGAGRTAEQLLKASDAMEMRSLFDGDEILSKLTANLLTFGNIAGNNFDRASQAALDLATRLGGDLQSATLLVGKALNDPVKGLNALRRVGIQFTADQQKQIKAMGAAGDIAGAQAIILSELERQFGGAAQAAADTSPWRAAQVALGQVGDTIGERLIPILQRLADFTVRALDAFRALPAGVQDTILVVAALAAAAGPLLIVIGAITSGLAPFIAGISAVRVAMIAANLPVTTLTLSIGVLRAAVLTLVQTLGPLALIVGVVSGALYLMSLRTKAQNEATAAYEAAQKSATAATEKAMTAVQSLTVAQGEARKEALRAALAERENIKQKIASARASLVLARAELARARAFGEAQNRASLGSTGVPGTGAFIQGTGDKARAVARDNLVTSTKTLEGLTKTLETLTAAINAPAPSVNTSSVITDPKKGSGSSRAASGPTAAEIEARFNNELLGYTQQNLSAMQQLATSAGERAEYAMRSVEWARRQTLAEIAADEDYSKAQKAELSAAVERMAENERQIVELRRIGDIEAEQADLAQDAYNEKRDLLQIDYQLADTQADRKRIALDILALEQEYRRNQLQMVLASKVSSDAEKMRAQAILDSIGSIEAAELAAAGRSNETELEAFLRSINRSPQQLGEDVTGVGLDGLDRLIDGISTSIAEVQSLGDAFKALRDIFQSVIQDMIAQLIRLGIQRALVGLIGGAFGGPSAGLLGSVNSTIAGNPGLFANGTRSAPGGMAWVGERGRELINLPKGTRVLNHGQSEIAARQMQASNVKPITFNLYGVNGERQGREAASQIAMRMRHSLNGA